MLGISLCTFGRHRIRRGTVRYDGWRFRGRCRGCGTDMVKDSMTFEWRLVTAEDPVPARADRR